MDSKSEFYVQGDDQRRFRMVIRGDVGRVTVAMIRKFLRPQGISGEYELRFNGFPLTDEMKGKDFGLEEGSVLQLVRPTSNNSKGSNVSDIRPMRRGDNSGEKKESSSSYQQLSHGDPNDLKGTFESENKKLKEEVHRLREELFQLEKRSANHSLPSTNLSRAPPERNSSHADSSNIAYEMAVESIRQLGEALQITDPPLQLGYDLTCSLGPPDMIIFITFDPATERLYLYSTLLSTIPEDEGLRTKLYEVLLQGSLLSREVCGGGIGISLESNLVILSTSLPLRYGGPEALKEIVPQFVTSLTRWRGVLEELFSI